MCCANGYVIYTCEEDPSMKKVRLAVAIVAAVPAAGLVAAPAWAVTYGPQAASGSVSPDVLTACSIHNPPSSAGGGSPNGSLTGLMVHGSRSNCVEMQTATLDNKQKGLEERIRFRSVNGDLLGTRWRPGAEKGNKTIYGSPPNVRAHQVCEALVLTTATSKVVYGPACEFT
jgi:hypothetical protein